MPSQLYKNENVTFICGRNFTYDGQEYEVGADFELELAVGRLEMLVRTRHIIPVVESTTEKPRHWHREIKMRADVERQLGADRAKGQINIERKEPEVTEDERVEEQPAKKTAAKKTAKKKA